jgi:hypothetical protein
MGKESKVEDIKAFIISKNSIPGVIVQTLFKGICASGDIKKVEILLKYKGHDSSYLYMMTLEACRQNKLDIITHIIENYPRNKLDLVLNTACNDNMDINVIELLSTYIYNRTIVLEYACRNNYDELISKLILTPPVYIDIRALFMYRGKSRDTHIKVLIKSTKSYYDTLIRAGDDEKSIKKSYITKLNDYLSLYYYCTHSSSTNIELMSLLVQDGAENIYMIPLADMSVLQKYLSTGLCVTHFAKDYPALCNQWIQFKKSTKKRLYQKLKRILIPDVLEIILLYIV